MARNKDLAHKIRRGKALKQNRSIPTWVVLKTKGRVRTSPYSNRNWRSQRLKKG
jgi:large subunit ribosomal protein L39e